jgi:hypothetical protein
MPSGPAADLRRRARATRTLVISMLTADRLGWSLVGALLRKLMSVQNKNENRFMRDSYERLKLPNIIVKCVNVSLYQIIGLI